jgi:hypothetical protein
MSGALVACRAVDVRHGARTPVRALDLAVLAGQR